MAAIDATRNPVKGEAYRLYFVIKSSSTSNPITGGLTGLAATISKDGAAFASTTNAPVEVGTSGFGYVDLTATEMNAYSVTIQVTASNANAIYSQSIIALNREQTVAAGTLPTDSYTVNLWSLYSMFNKSVATLDQITFYKSDDSTVLATGVFLPTDTGGTRFKLRGP